MNKSRVLLALAALAQDTRLDAFRSLVQAGPAGLPAGELAASLGVPAATLSFHLKELHHADLVTREREGRSIVYAPDFGVIRAVVDYLGENCCGNADCCEPGPREETPCNRPQKEES